MKQLKALALSNIIGFLICTGILVLSISLNPFPWDVFLIAINIHLALPFVVFAIITLRNLKQPKAKAVRIWFIICFLLAWLPTISLPFSAGILGGVASAVMLLVGIYGMFYSRSPEGKMCLFNWIGLLFLMVDTIGVAWIVQVNW